MINITKQIRQAQIAAGEAAVLRSLEAQGLAPAKPLQVLTFTHNGTTLHVSVDDMSGLLCVADILGGASCTVDLTTMTRAEYESLADLGGF